MFIFLKLSIGYILEPDISAVNLGTIFFMIAYIRRLNNIVIIGAIKYINIIVASEIGLIYLASIFIIKANGIA